MLLSLNRLIVRNGVLASRRHGGNPVACAAALQLIDIIKQEGLLENEQARHLPRKTLKIRPEQDEISLILIQVSRIYLYMGDHS